MTNRKIILVFGATILALSFMGFFLYQAHVQKEAALEQVRLLKQKAEAEERRAIEQRKAEEERKQAEIAELQRINAQRKFAEEELRRFRERQELEAGEARRKEEEAQRVADRKREEELAKIREREQRERKGKADQLEHEIRRVEDQMARLQRDIRDRIRIIEDNDRRRAHAMSRTRYEGPTWNPRADPRFFEQRENHIIFIERLKGEWAGLNQKANQLRTEYKNLTIQ